MLEIYKFQNDIDMRYIKHLEDQLGKYKELISHIVDENPRMKNYINNFFSMKSTPYKQRSVSENIQHHKKERKYEKSESDKFSIHDRKTHSNAQNSYSNIVEARPIKETFNKNYSGKLNNNLPNINYNTAYRSSKRPGGRRDYEDDHRGYR